MPVLPQPVVLGGVPDGCHHRDGSLCPGPGGDCFCDKYTLTKDGLVSLIAYLVGVREWIAAANRCLAPWQTAAMPGRVVKLCGRHCDGKVVVK